MLSGNDEQRCYRTRVELMSGNREALLSSALITCLPETHLRASPVGISDTLFYWSLRCLSVQDNGLEFSNSVHRGFRETVPLPHMFTVRSSGVGSGS